MGKQFWGSLLSILLFAGPAAWAVSADVIPPITTTKLTTGQTVYVQEIHTMPIVTIDTWVNTGSAEEVAANNGVSHFLEHLLFKGTEHYQIGEIDRILEAGGADFNAATSDDFTHFHITTTPAKFKEALTMHADMLLNATINPPELMRERNVVQEEINRALDNPQRKSYLALDQLLFSHHPYGMDTLGPKSNIQTIPREKILGYYHTWYQPKNFKTIIVGDVNTQEATQEANEAFEKALIAQARPPIGIPKTVAVTPLTQPKSRVLSDPNLSSDQLDIGFLAPGIEKRNDNFALDVAAIILGQGASSRLYRDVKEEQQLVDTITAANVTQKQAGVFMISAELKPEHREAAKKAILTDLAQFKQEGPTASELEKAKKQVLKEYAYLTESTDGAAETIGYNVTIGKLEDYTEYVRNIQQVTAKQVKEAVQKYLKPSEAAMVELLPSDLAKDPVEDEKANVALLKDASHIQAASVETPENTTVGEPQKIVLKDGATLIMKRNPSTQTVAISIFAKGGQLLEEKPGTSLLTSQVLLKGTHTRSATEISEALEAQGISIASAQNEDYFQVNSNCLTDDLPKLMFLLSDVLSQPAFAQDQIDKERADALESIKTSRDEPSNLMFEKLTESLYPSHPYGSVGDRLEASLPGITRKDILSYYQKQLQPHRLVIVVVGNFSPTLVQSDLEQILATLPQNTDMADHFPNVTPLSKPVEVDSKKPRQAAAWVGYGWLAPGISTNTDYATLKVINALLGTGLSSRLFVDLREKQGLAYQVSTQFPSTLKSSRFVMFIGTDPKNVQKVQTGFDMEITRLLDEPVSADELARAKTKLAGLFALSHESNANQAFYMGLYETLGVGYQFDTQYPKLIDQVTSNDITQVSKAIFTTPRVVSIVAPEVARTEDSTLPAAVVPAEK